MAEWRFDNASGRSNNSEILQSWGNFDPAASQPRAEFWQGNKAIPAGLGRNEVPQLQKLEIADNGLSDRVAPRFDINQGKASLSPLGRVNEMLDDNSPSSRWLKERGYLEAFKPENCTLELSFGSDRRGNRVGAVLVAPDGTKRTAVAFENGSTCQRVTGPNGEELVTFLSNGNVIELNPYKSAGRKAALEA